MANKKSYSAQVLANSFPLWSNIRKDEQSLGHQLLNVLGNKLDDLRKQNVNIGANYYLNTSVVSDIDVFYQFNLPGDYQFTKLDNDETEFLFTPPTVSGQLTSDDSYVELTIAEENSIENFWNNAIPDTISLDLVNSGEFHVASGYAYEAPLVSIPVSGVIDPPNHLHVSITSGQRFIYVNNSNRAVRTIVQIDGLNRQGKEIKEDLYFIENDRLTTLHDYKQFNNLNVFGVQNESSSFIEVDSFNFNQEDLPISYNLAQTLEKKELPLFWSVGTNQSGTRVLDLRKYEIDDEEIRSNGFSDKFTLLQQELLDTDGNSVEPLDIAVEPKSKFLWAVTSGMLYLFNDDIPYTDNKLLSNKDYDAESVIEPSSYYGLLNEDIELNYVWVRPVKGIFKHRVWVQKPDGTKKSIEDGSFVTYHTDSSSWVYGEPRDRRIRNSDIFTLDQRGDWLFTLEVSYADGSSSIDQRVVQVVSKQALAEYDLISLGIPNRIKGIDFDSEYKMWVLDIEGGKYQIGKHYHNMLIDFSRKILYFREKFKQIRVI